MLTLDTFSLTEIRQFFTPANLNKARSYLRHIYNAARSGNILTAEVVGSHRYEVEIEVMPASMLANCTCPYGNYCKHVGAVLLKWVESPQSFSLKEAATPGSGSGLTVFLVEPLPAQKPKALPFWVSETAAERRQRDIKKLEQALEQLKVQELRELAKKRGWAIKGTSKADLAQQISQYLLQPEQLEKAWVGLDGEHRQVVRALVLLGQEEGLRLADIERIAEVWGKLKSYKNVTTYTRHLNEAGLALPTTALGIYGIEADVVPRAIARQLPPPLAEVIPSHTHRPPDPEADELRLADPTVLVRQANQVALLLEQSSTPLRSPMPRPSVEKFYPSLTEWDYDRDEVWELSRSSKIKGYASDVSLSIPPPAWSLPDDVVARLAPIAGDEARLEFIFALLVAAGLFQPGSPVTVWPEVKERYLRQSEAAQRTLLARIYFLMLTWSELWQVLRLDPHLQLRRTWTYLYFKPTNLRIELARFRQMVLRALAGLPDGQWVALNDLQPLLRAVWPRFDSLAWQTYFGYSMKPNWFLTYQGRELKPDDKQDWQIAQWPFIHHLITGPLHWLGLADLSLKNSQPVAVRFQGLADLFWDRVEIADTPRVSTATAPTPAKTPAQAVKLDESSITVDPAAISAQAHNLLDQLARLDEALPGRFVYRLDAQAAHQSFEKGVALADLLNDWQQFLTVPMPAAMRSQLEAWWQAYGQVRIYEDVTLIEFGDDYTLTEMKAVTSLSQHLIAELSPRLALIPKQVVGLLTAELEKAGYTPRQTDDVQ